MRAFTVRVECDPAKTTLQSWRVKLFSLFLFLYSRLDTTVPFFVFWIQLPRYPINKSKKDVPFFPSLFLHSLPLGILR